MALTRWDPFDDLLRIQERMNRMFEDSLGDKRSEAGAGSGWSPSVDIYETQDNVVVVADLPGVEREDIEIRLENNTLVIGGERRMQKDVNQESYHRVERGHGTFQRTFTLPTTIAQDKIRASYRNGILEVFLPKTAGEGSKRIEVDISG